MEIYIIIKTFCFRGIQKNKVFRQKVLIPQNSLTQNGKPRYKINIDFHFHSVASANYLEVKLEGGLCFVDQGKP